MKRKEIRILLLQKDVTQKDIARKIKVDPSYITRLFNHERKGDKTRKKIAKILGVSEKRLFGKDLHAA